MPEPLEIMLPEKSGKKNRQSILATLLIPVPVACAVLISFILYAQNVSSQEGQEAAQVAEVPETQRWNQLRGNNGLGIVAGLEVPVSWNGETEENIAWKTPIPMKGNSSPVIWGDRIFLTGADLDQRKIFCFDLGTGSLLWETAIQTPVVVDEDMKRTESMGDTGFGSPTAVTNGEQVVAFFGTNEIAAVDFTGKQIWSKWLGKPDSMYGVATSPCLFENKAILQLDQGSEEGPKSALYAFNPADGRIIWKTDRDVPASWSSPIAVDTGERKQILTAANPWVISYNPDNGVELWRAKVLEGDVAPIPAYGDGLVFTAVDYSQLSAVEVTGSGDVTETHVRWTFDEELPDIPSPVTDGKYLFLPTSYGYMLMFDAKTGENFWTEEIRGDFWSSPIVIGDKIFLTDTEGKTYILKFGPEYEILGEAELGEKVVTTPAFVENRIVIRGEENLYCIGSKEWQSDTMSAQ
ncbi:MAG: PQQ-like beta-propeller repeat protein [Candidatus Omnitrophica bacterium]|nr:PQQ-like beta-propeller repeat protein [Candidatus Omnitrophota bacterium]